MNAFEKIVAQVLEEEGYWVRHQVKVDLSKKDKQHLGNPSMPRPEIDLVAYNAKRNVLLVVEVKSFLDSQGVRYDAVSGENTKLGERYKLFTNDALRQIVADQLLILYKKAGLIRSTTKVKYALAAGRVYSNDQSRIEAHFKKKGWEFFSPDRIKTCIRKLAEKGYEDDLVTMTAKLLYTPGESIIRQALPTLR